MGAIHRKAEHIVRKYGTRNPYELLDAMGAVTRITYEFEPKGLKGFAAIMNGICYATVNGNLTEQERFIVAGHEAAHLILHRQEILLSPACALKDFNLYDNSGKLEFEANSFLADFLISDEQVMDIISNPDRDYFSAAKELFLPPPLFAFKLYSMMHRGFNVRNPACLKSDFLGKTEIW